MTFSGALSIALPELILSIGILVLLVLQWYALARKLFGKPVGWRQRTYSSATGTEVG